MTTKLHVLIHTQCDTAQLFSLQLTKTIIELQYTLNSVFLLSWNRNITLYNRTC